MTQLRSLAVSKRDLLMINPTLLKVEEGYNIRDLSTQHAKDKLRDLANSIKENGVQTPLTVRLKGDDVFIVAGHRRHAAACLAIQEGAEIESVPCIAEAKGTAEADRIADLIISNSGEPLTPLETASVIKRLSAFGWSQEKIAAKLGWTSIQTVDNYLILLSAPQSVQNLVRDNQTSASTAIALTRKHGPDGAATLLEAAKVEATACGKLKVTLTHVRKANHEFQATPANIKTLIDALTKIYQDGDEDDAKIALLALTKVGVLRK
jgi:ParB family chromosome partitioning protein